MNDVDSYIEILRKLSDGIEVLTSSSFPQYYEDWIIEYFEPINVKCMIGNGFFPIIERITVNKRVISENLRINDVNKLKYPPPEYVNRFGRANLKKQSVFYGTFDFMTAIKEMKPKRGDLITVSEWKIKVENDCLVTCPIFMNQPEDGTINVKLLNLYHSFKLYLESLPPEYSKSIVEIHQFIANCFVKKIDSNNNQGYIYSALLADKIFNKYEGGVVDAIIYPSTQEGLRTENIAIKKDSFDKKYVFSKSTEKKLVDISKDGDEYVFELLGESRELIGETVIWT